MQCMDSDGYAVCCGSRDMLRSLAFVVEEGPVPIRCLLMSKGVYF